MRYKQIGPMQKESSGRNNAAFLDKFQGKKSVISREGLLHLLDAKRQNQDAKMPPRRIDPITKQSPNPSTSQQLLKSKPRRAKQIKDNPLIAQELRARYERLHEQLKQPKSMEFHPNNIRLPAINKSSSHANHLRPKLQSSTEQTEDPPLKPRSLPRRTEKSESLVANMTKKMELDKYALRHLQFLDKFERMVQGEGKGSVHSEHL